MLERDDKRLLEIARNEIERVHRFIATWFRGAVAGSSDEFERQLGASIFSQPDVQPPFRQKYSQLLLPRLKELLESESDQAAVNALYVVGKIGTDDALELLTDYLDSQNVIRRINAAARAKLTIEDFGNGRSLVRPASIPAFAREVEEVALVESNPYALQRQIELLNALYVASQQRADVLGQLQDTVQTMRINVLESHVEDFAPEKANALSLLVERLRGTFIADDNRQRRDGPTIARSLHGILQAARDEWEDAQAAVHHAAMLGELIGQTENFLKFVDQTVRRDPPPTPNTSLSNQWRTQDWRGFQEDLRLWDDILALPVYRS